MTATDPLTVSPDVFRSVLGNLPTRAAHRLRGNAGMPHRAHPGGGRPHRTDRRGAGHGDLPRPHPAAVLPRQLPRVNPHTQEGNPMSTNPFENNDHTYFVLVNEEGQHSLWPALATI